MTLRFTLLFALATTVAHADEAPPLDVFLEQRVAEELAADGLQLSRLGVSLDVELVGNQAIVSLRDRAAHRVVASTKLDSLPTDRDAAIASVTQVAANLAAQLAPPPPNDFKDALREERADRERKQELEARYNEKAIHFNHLPVVTGDGETTTTTITAFPLQGDRRLSPPEFYNLVERPDLAARYSRRRNLGKGLLVAGTLGIVAGFAVIGWGVTGKDCIGAEDLPMCIDEKDKFLAPRVKVGLGVAAAGAGAFLFGIYFVRRSIPISESEAHDLADRHNEKLRKQLQLAPYVGPGGGGISMSGRF
jgi:hypothetical protein